MDDLEDDGDAWSAVSFTVVTVDEDYAAVNLDPIGLATADDDTGSLLLQACYCFRMRFAPAVFFFFIFSFGCPGVLGCYSQSTQPR